MNALDICAKNTEQVKKKGREIRQTAVQLPQWAERNRGLPNSLARCALFTASGKTEPRKDFKRAPIVSVDGFQIAYTGEELRQDDQDVFLQLVHMARGENLGTKIQITAHSILVELGWGRSKDAYGRLQKSVVRLREGMAWVSFNDGRKGFTGNMIDALDWEDDKWMLSLDPRITALFGADTYTAINWQQRLKLGPLAKWLHSFYFTHREPYPYTVQKLYELCGSKAKLLKHFRASLKKAHDELVGVQFLQDWNFDPKSDKISVRRRHVPTLSGSAA
jgi:hypothetical protein